MSQANVLFDEPGPKGRMTNRIIGVVGFLILGGITLWVVLELSKRPSPDGTWTAQMWRPFVDSGTWSSYLIPGILATLKAAGLAIVLSLVVGTLLGMGRMSGTPLLRWPCAVVVEFFRAVPVLLMMYFLFRLFSQEQIGPPGEYAFWATVVALTLYNGSVIAEVLRSGVGSLPKGQREAGLTVGLTEGQVLRSILLPQAFTAMLPALVSQLVVVLKDSALGYAIGYTELLNQGKTLGSVYSNIIPVLIVVAVLYIAINWCITKLAETIESRLRQRGRATTSAKRNVNVGSTGPDMKANTHTG